MAGMMRPRLIGKEQARMVANAGGAIGVWTHLADAPLDYAKNIRALVDVIGVDHVCIGTDTKLTQPFGGRGGGRPGGGPPGGGPPGGGRGRSTECDASENAPIWHGRIKRPGSTTSWSMRC